MTAPGSAEPWREYHCDVIAEGPVYGTGDRVAVVLGTFTTVSPKLALRWIGGQALRIANGLDPGWARPIKDTEHTPGPDGPTVLRAVHLGIEWLHGPREQLRAGAPVSLVISDGGNGTYTLAVWPVAVRPDPAPDPGIARPLLVQP